MGKSSIHWNWEPLSKPPCGNSATPVCRSSLRHTTTRPVSRLWTNPATPLSRAKWPTAPAACKAGRFSRQRRRFSLDDTKPLLPSDILRLFLERFRALSELNAPARHGCFFFFICAASSPPAIRLGIVGPMEGQALQHRLSPVAGEILATCEVLTVAEATQTAPLLEIWQGTQDRLYSRLFQS